eukprot:11195653-Lingulodinium_polyedra.AAC.1
MPGRARGTAWPNQPRPRRRPSRVCARSSRRPRTARPEKREACGRPSMHPLTQSVEIAWCKAKAEEGDYDEAIDIMLSK